MRALFLLFALTLAESAAAPVVHAARHGVAHGDDARAAALVQHETSGHNHIVHCQGRARSADGAAVGDLRRQDEG